MVAMKKEILKISDDLNGFNDDGRANNYNDEDDD